MDRPAEMSTFNEASVPTASSPSPSQKANIKLVRSLTEKRKNYVQRISARTANNAPSTYGTLHRTFKSPILKTFSVESKSDESDHEPATTTNELMPDSTSVRISKYKKLTESTNAPVMHRHRLSPSLTETDESPNRNAATVMPNAIDESQHLFQMCLLVGYNTSTASAYIKSCFPMGKTVPQNIEQLVFPSGNLVHRGRDSQDYSLILTDDQGYRIYGYCRRVLPESCEICLPLAYCVISDTKAPGFYFKILKEIESRHGQTDAQSNFLLKNLQSRLVPEPGKFLHLKLPLPLRPKTIFMSNHKISAKRLSLEINPKWLTESAAQAAFSDSDGSSPGSEAKGFAKKSAGLKSLVQEYEEKKLERAPFDLGLINRSLDGNRTDEIFIRRPNDLRLESTELSDL